ncbi:hypothetical protein BGZ76_008926 [Entomortierella beljakovae]|nr:hypothetical protein BGZ76_008926 [Entomortierella beljakovae]
MIALGISDGHGEPISPGARVNEHQYTSDVDTSIYPNQDEPLLFNYSSKESRHPQSNQQEPPSIILRTLGLSWTIADMCYSRATAWMFPNEPEPLDLKTTVFFVAQAPIIAMVAWTWIPKFIGWMLGIKISQAGDHGTGHGMRKTWNFSLAFALSFLQTYLHYAEHLTIEECQGRSRAIPFMTAPSGTRINKVKIPLFPYRGRAENILYDCLSEQERDILSIRRNTSYTQEHDQLQKSEIDNINGFAAGQPHKTKNAHMSDDQFVEALDAEWLEYIGPDEIGAEKPNSSNCAAVLYLHGGGYYSGSKEEHRVMIGPLVKRLGKNIRIININYRLAPQSPFPGALIDALSSYMWLLDQTISETFGLDDGSTEKFQPNQIVFMGDSAGGGLALSLSLLIRDHGSLPQPLSIVTWSPWLDLTQSLPSFKENAFTDCIPYEHFTHKHSEVVDKMFEKQERRAAEEGEDSLPIRQRAQVYCPDECLRMKYVSPLYETDYRGIPSVFITCGSAERFSNECILMAARLEEQQQPCRIDIHEDMPHVFPLFRFHPSAITALDTTCTYIREVVRSSLAYSINEDVVIPISSSSSSSSSRASSPILPSGPFEQTAGGQVFDFGESITRSPRGPVPVDGRRSRGVQRTNSLSSISSIASEDSAASSSSQSLLARAFSKSKEVLLRRASFKDTPDPVVAKPTIKVRATVNVVELSGKQVLSYHKRNRYGSVNDPSSQRRRRRTRLTLRDIVSEATLFEWEVLLRQGYVPEREWPYPPSF